MKPTLKDILDNYNAPEASHILIVNGGDMVLDVAKQGDGDRYSLACANNSYQFNLEDVEIFAGVYMFDELGGFQTITAYRAERAGEIQ